MDAIGAPHSVLPDQIVHCRLLKRPFLSIPGECAHVPPCFEESFGPWRRLDDDHAAVDGIGSVGVVGAADEVARVLYPAIQRGGMIIECRIAVHPHDHAILIEELA